MTGHPRIVILKLAAHFMNLSLPTYAFHKIGVEGQRLDSHARRIELRRLVGHLVARRYLHSAASPANRQGSPHEAPVLVPSDVAFLLHICAIFKELHKTHGVLQHQEPAQSQPLLLWESSACTSQKASNEASRGSHRLVVDEIPTVISLGKSH